MSPEKREQIERARKKRRPAITRASEGRDAAGEEGEEEDDPDDDDGGGAEDDGDPPRRVKGERTAFRDHAHKRLPGAVHNVRSFCLSNNISYSLYYRLKREGR